MLSADALLLIMALPLPLLSDSSEQATWRQIQLLLGEYRTRCLGSKAWVLREAAILKTKLLLEDADGFCVDPGLSSCLGSLVGIVEIGLDDNIQQVLFQSIGLLESVLEAARRSALPRFTAPAPAPAPAAEVINIAYIFTL